MMDNRYQILMELIAEHANDTAHAPAGDLVRMETALGRMTMLLCGWTWNTETDSYERQKGE
ncbi:MAG: hypothetical protein IJI10_10040, partial [Eubacterium sp.]|nr:hypothetical protein [Eubacterium sp.]